MSQPYGVAVFEAGVTVKANSIYFDPPNSIFQLNYGQKTRNNAVIQQKENRMTRPHHHVVTRGVSVNTPNQYLPTFKLQPPALQRCKTTRTLSTLPRRALAVLSLLVMDSFQPLGIPRLTGIDVIWRKIKYLASAE